MRKFILLCMATVCAQASQADVATKEVVVNISEALVSSTLSRNTNAKVTLSGMFSNTCYSFSRGEVVNKDATTHYVRAMAWYTTNGTCLMFFTNYLREVDLGRLSPGDHTIRFISSDESWFEKTVTVQ